MFRDDSFFCNGLYHAITRLKINAFAANFFSTGKANEQEKSVLTIVVKFYQDLSPHINLPQDDMLAGFFRLQMNRRDRLTTFVMHHHFHIGLGVSQKFKQTQREGACKNQYQ